MGELGRTSLAQPELRRLSPGAVPRVCFLSQSVKQMGVESLLRIQRFRGDTEVFPFWGGNFWFDQKRGLSPPWDHKPVDPLRRQHNLLGNFSLSRTIFGGCQKYLQCK